MARILLGVTGALARYSFWYAQARKLPRVLVRSATPTSVTAWQAAVRK